MLTQNLLIPNKKVKARGFGFKFKTTEIICFTAGGKSFCKSFPTLQVEKNTYTQ